MVPLGKKEAGWLRTKEDALHRSIALGHASLHDRPGLWADDPDRPRSVLWLREGDEGALEAFAAGVPGPAVGWLAARARGRTIALLAPPAWEKSVRAIGGGVEIAIIQTRRGPESWEARPSPIATRRLALADRPAFEAIAPPWALRSWGDYPTLIEKGLAIGVPTSDGLASIAWTYESDQAHEKLGVSTFERFRNLGLARSAASALLGRITEERHKKPIWVTSTENPASIALARKLGFSNPTEEPLIRWTPPAIEPPP